MRENDISAETLDQILSKSLFYYMTQLLSPLKKILAGTRTVVCMGYCWERMLCVFAQIRHRSNDRENAASEAWKSRRMIQSFYRCMYAPRRVRLTMMVQTWNTDSTYPVETSTSEKDATWQLQAVASCYTPHYYIFWIIDKNQLQLLLADVLTSPLERLDEPITVGWATFRTFTYPP